MQEAEAKFRALREKNEKTKAKIRERDRKIAEGHRQKLAQIEQERAAIMSRRQAERQLSAKARPATKPPMAAPGVRPPAAGNNKTIADEISKRAKR